VESGYGLRSTTQNSGVREKRFANVPERKLACEFYEFRIIAFVCNAVMP
jgi:hypothetical protein